MSEVCTDNRYEVIAAYKKKLMERTNIETSPDEMAVIDNLLFRFWQLGWLPPVPHGRLIDADVLQAKQQEDADLFIDSNSLEDADLFVDSYSLTDKIRRDEALNAVANIVNAPTIIQAEEAE